MSLLYNIVYTILLGECSVLTFFVLPIPLEMRKDALEFLSSNPAVQQLLHAVRISFIGVGVLFLDAWRIVYADVPPGGHDDDVVKKRNMSMGFDQQARFWRAQRNLYLTGFTLFLGFVLYCFFETLLELQGEVQAAKKRAEEDARQKYEELNEAREAEERKALQRKCEELLAM
ncbi:endoplasmic reticulum protein [Hyaloraphidium curvatum]|nr:endoplasmic reticulum protein [Hyaloraphidium curvatum]